MTKDQSIKPPFVDTSTPICTCRIGFNDNEGGLILASIFDNSTQVNIPGKVAKLVTRILWLCDGTNQILDIGVKSGVGSDDFTALMSLLYRHKILVNSTELAGVATQVGSNPQRYNVARLPGSGRSKLETKNPLRIKEGAIDKNRVYMGRLRSTRVFVDRVPDKSYLESLLEYAYSSNGAFWTIPSAGAFYDFTIYVLVKAERGRFYWHCWDPIRRRLGAVDGVKTPLGGRAVRFITDYEFADLPDAWIFILASSGCRSDKYSNRGVLYQLLEAGMISERVFRWLNENEYGVFPYGGFSEKDVLRSLRKEGNVLFAMACGVPERSFRQGEFNYRFWADLTNSARDLGWHVAETFIDAGEGHVRLSRVSFRTPDGEYRYSFGRGATRREADVKAIVEASERFACTNRGSTAVGGRVGGDIVLASDFFSGKYGRDIDNSINNVDGERRFYQGTHVASGKEVFVDSLLVEFWGKEQSIHRITTSNGVAAHRDLETASVEAFLELVERGNIIDWMNRDINATEIDDVAGILSSLECYIPPGCTVRLWVLRGELLPSVACAIVSDEYPHLAFGAACGGNLESAVEKAFLEAYTCRGSLSEQERIHCGDATRGLVYGARDHGMYYAGSPENTARFLDLVNVDSQKLSWKSAAGCFKFNKSDVLAAMSQAEAIVVRLDSVMPQVVCCRVLSSRVTPLFFGPVDGDLGMYQTGLLPHPLM